MQINTKSPRGFTLIELMIVIAIIATLVAIALPAYQDYSIRAKVGEGLSIAATAKMALADTCQTDGSLIISDGAQVGFIFEESKFVLAVEIAADCSTGSMAIAIQTQNTGADDDPIILLTTNGFFFLVASGSSASWNCLGVAQKSAHLPAGCRTTEQRFYSELGNYAEA